MIRALLVALLATVPALCLAGTGQSAEYSVNNQSYEGYFVTPAPDAPLVLLLHDWDGLTDYEIQRADMLAGMGYAVFAADLFGKGVRPTTVEDKRQHTGELYQDRDKLRALMQGALRSARGLGADTDHAVAMGYCFGGAAVLELARSGADLEGFVTFHGGLSTPEGQDYSKAKGRYLIQHGTADGHITMDHFGALANELESAGLPHTMTTYGGAPHAFTVFGQDSYREQADQSSWAAFGRFLDATLKR
ncbi:dienelactone hydrolase family protein [Abyssibacter sp.]|jgi:dienelactone hydrolase|uniref:dienelactone hydrolase family protein n=1 Tax=Abyssibacter sp. TaxID=2320200 RepID=UPI000C55673C|nr:dienelactone hydrolase [Xanthomonadales bacterium]